MRFNIPTEARDIANQIYFAYKAEVKSRNRELIFDEPTRENMLRMAEILTEANSPRFGVVLCGTFGNGKTTLLRATRKAIHHFFLHSGKLVTQYNTRIPLISAKDIIIKARSESEFLELKTIDLLMIDDMGAEPKEVTEFGTVATPLTDLLEARYNRMKYTFITTNLMPSELSEKYGLRLADRFREMFDVIAYEHPSYRTR